MFFSIAHGEGNIWTDYRCK